MPVLLPIILALLSLIQPIQSIECGPSVRYPINGSLPVIDYDVNCNVQSINNSTFWFPRTANMTLFNTTNQSTNQSINQSIDITRIDRRYNALRKVFSLEFASLGSNKLSIPVDIRPSTLPISTIEMFVRLPVIRSGDVTFLYSSSSAGQFNQSIPSRALMPSDVTGPCGAHLHPYGINSSNPCTLPVSNAEGYLHIVTTWDQPNQSVSIWLNGIFSQNWTLSTVDDLTMINVNGRIGTNFYDLSSLSFVYLRVWDRYLSGFEMLALNNDWFAVYNQPILTQSFPTILFDETPTLSAAVSSGFSYWQLNQHTLSLNSSVILETSYGTQLSNIDTSSDYRYTALFRACRYPSRVYTLAPFYATPDLCEWPVSTNVALLSAFEPLRIERITSAAANLDERYVAGLSNFVRVSHFVTFNKPVKQSINMPLAQVIQRGQGFEFIDSLPLSIYSNDSTFDAQDSWTRLSEDRRSFLWQFNIESAVNGNTRLHGLPDASQWRITDDQDVPLAVTRTVRQDQPQYWYTVNQTVATGLRAIITLDGLGVTRVSDGAYELGFNLTWNEPVLYFNPVGDVTLCEGCILIDVNSINSTIPRYHYLIRTPILDDDSDFRVRFAFNTSTSHVRHPTLDWLTIGRSASVYPPMIGSFHITDGGIADDEDDEEIEQRLAGDLGISKEVLAGCIIGSVLAFLIFLWLFRRVAKRRTNDRLANYPQHPKPTINTTPTVDPNPATVETATVNQSPGVSPRTSVNTVPV